MSKGRAPLGVTRKGLTVVAMAALFVGAMGLGVAEGGGKFLTKSKANKTYLSKKSAKKTYLAKPTKLQVPATTGIPQSANADYEDTNATSSGARHLDTGFSTIGWAWILPPHYVAGRSLNVKIYYALNTSGCNFDLRPNSLSVNKIGSLSTGSQNEITTGDTILPAPSPAGAVTSKTWTIPGTVNGTQLAPGTAVTMGTFRNPTLVEDTCNNSLNIKGMEVSW